MIEQRELDEFASIHRRGTEQLQLFLFQAIAYHDQRRKDDGGPKLGQPLFINARERIDQPHAWYIFDGVVIVPEAYSGEDYEFPLGVLTGEVSPEEYVDSFWEKHAAEKAKRDEARRQSKIKELHKLMDEFPEEWQVPQS